MGAPPFLELAEHILDLVALAVGGLVEAGRKTESISGGQCCANKTALARYQLAGLRQRRGTKNLCFNFAMTRADA